MASINASTSGGGGVITTADASGNLNIQSGGSTVVAVTSTGVAVTGTLAATGAVTLTGSLNTPNTFGFKNRIINGGMVIDQRNAGASVTPTSGQYLTDRFQAVLTQASKFTAIQSTTAPTEFTNSLLITSSSAYSVVAGDIFAVQQVIEGYNIADLGFGTANAKTFTISFWVRSSLTGTFGGSLRNADNTRSYPFTYTISSANTWEQKTVTVVGDTSGTWQTTNLAGIKVEFGLGGGATYSGTAGAWASANYQTATGATSVVGTSGATFYITGVQLEKGSTATSFDFRDYGRELIMCQRYLPMYGFATDDQIGVGQCSGTTSWAIQIPHIVQPRVAPTGITTGAAANFNVTNSVASGVAVSSISFSAGGLSGSRVTGAVASGLTAGNATILRSQNTSGFIQFTGCEL